MIKCFLCGKRMKNIGIKNRLKHWLWFHYLNLKIRDWFAFHIWNFSIVIICEQCENL